MKIVIVGGSGSIGKKLVKSLCDRGHEAVAASPSSGVNRRRRGGGAEGKEETLLFNSCTPAPLLPCTSAGFFIL